MASRGQNTLERAVGEEALPVARLRDLECESPLVSKYLSKDYGYE